jgi:HD-GYP domain-containing protein (c-di-GMP phosphodiesterase class II)
MILMSLDDVRPSMVLGVTLYNKEGQTLLGPGVALTPSYLGRLRELGYSAVWIDDPDTRDISYDHVLTESTRVGASVEARNTVVRASREAPALRLASTQEIRDALETRRFQRAFENDEGVERLQEQLDAVLDEIPERPMLSGVGCVRSYDTHFFHHCVDVMVTAVVIGRLVGYDLPTLKKMAVGCMLHDIGKIFSDETTLGKSTSLSAEESRRLRDHTVLGYLLIRDSLRLGVLAAHVAYQHHEKQDGSGYPRGLTGTNRILRALEAHVPGQITPLAEIAAIADFHDSRSFDRPYRKAFAPDQVWQMIRDGAGTHFNRELVDLFLSVLPPFPLGTRVVVTDGRWHGCTGVVSRVDRHALGQPVVRLLADEAGKRLEPFEIDLKKDDVTVCGLDGRQRALVP